MSPAQVARGGGTKRRAGCFIPRRMFSTAREMPAEWFPRGANSGASETVRPPAWWNVRDDMFVALPTGQRDGTG